MIESRELDDNFSIMELTSSPYPELEVQLPVGLKQESESGNARNEGLEPEDPGPDAIVYTSTDNSSDASRHLLSCCNHSTLSRPGK